MSFSRSSSSSTSQSAVLLAAENKANLTKLTTLTNLLGTEKLGSQPSFDIPFPNEEINKLFGIFKGRKAEILGRRGQPGRAQTVLGNTFPGSNLI